MHARSLLCGIAISVAACGGAKKAPSVATVADAGAPDAATDEDAEPKGPVEHPFAKDSKEALHLMEAAVDTRARQLGKCVEAFRARKRQPMAKLVVTIGVDQEGVLIGVTGKEGETDTEASECVRRALRRAPFPKSHAGVIEIVKTFEYQPTY